MRTMVSALQLCAYRNDSVAAAWLLDVGGANLELQDSDGATLLLNLLRASVVAMRPFPLQRSQRIDASDHVEVCIACDCK